MTRPAPSGAKSQKPKSDKRPAKPGASAPGPDSAPRGIVAQPSRTPIPMKPRKGVFIALMSVFALWVGVMLTMYVTTVRPRRHSAPPPASQPPPASTAPSLAGQSP